ncbi:MAG: hypothetical protein M0R03_23730, partial [Novosphingobium sp.]|nr:hypothetical protein [Novosphingobium sp.]
GVPVQEALGYLWFFLIGFAFYGLNEVSERDKNSVRTPRKWSWVFWASDNLNRYLYTIIATYIMFRFYTNFTDQPLNDFNALMMGIVGDGIGASIKRKRKATQSNRYKIMDEHKNTME